ncbi:MAG: hypothetical protein ABWX71_09920 [Aeromicrobium sp.]
MANRTVLVRLHANSAGYIAAMKAAGAATKGLHDEIDKTNDRTAWLAQSVLAVAPAATTLGAAAVPVISGMATQMTVAAGAAGVMALGFNGVGDALGALNDYQLDPSTEKLEKLNEEMGKIGQEGEKFVRFLDGLGPQFSHLANTSREGMFPGVTRGIREFMDLMPELNRIVDQTAKGIGQLARDAGSGLSGEGFADFFEYLENDARPILVQFGRTIGNFAEGIANMIVAFGPLSSDFSKGMLEMSRAFVDWSDALSSSAGFAEFVSYVREAGPQALDFLSSLSMALVEIVEAAAPIGAVMLPRLTDLFDIIAHLADTPLGPTVLAFTALTSAWGRLNAIASITGSGALAKATTGFRGNAAAAKLVAPSLRELGTAMLYSAHSQDTLRTAMVSGSKASADGAKKALLAKTQVAAFGKSIAPVAGQVAFLGAVTTGVADKMGLANAATGALIGSMLGPWGAAGGAAIGVALDFAQANDDLTDSLRNADRALNEASHAKAGTANMTALEASVEAARQKVQELKDDVASSGNILTEVDHEVESLFGLNDTQEAVADLIVLEEKLAAVREREGEASRQRAANRAYYNYITSETEALEDNIQAMRDKREEALTGMNADLDYAEALLQTAKAAKDNAGVLTRTGDLQGGPKQRQAGIDALRQLNDLGAAWNNLSDKAQNAPGAHKAAKDSFVDLATQMGMGEKAARTLARKILDIPSKTLEVRVEDKQARARLKTIRQSIDNIDRNIVVGVHVVRGDSSGLAYLSGGLRRYADGGTIDGPRFPYGDKVVIAAAPGEEMVSNRYGGADKNRDELKAASRGAKLAVIGYADGGTIGATSRAVAAGRSYPAATPSYAAAAGAGIDYDRLAKAMLLARPVHGDVHISGDPSEYKRHMLQDEQAAGLGGFGG